MKPKTVTGRLRAAVCKRAAGACEACGRWVGENGEDGELDHVFNRRTVPQAVSNCQMLCRMCHRDKTESRPSAAHHMLRFWLFAQIHDYDDEAHRAAVRLSVLAQKSAVAR